MLFRYFIVSCAVLLCYFKIGNSNELKKKFYKRSNNDDIQNPFAKLLNNIVRVNEERIEAMKKIIHLQDYILTKNRLKNYEDFYDSSEDDYSRSFRARGLSTSQLRDDKMGAM